MRRCHPLFDPLPPGYSGPAPLPRPAQGPQQSAPGEPEFLEEVPFELSDSVNPAHQVPVDRADMPLPKPKPKSIEEAEGTALPPGTPMIRNFEQRLVSDKLHEDSWNRTPNTNGSGAIHVKSFHCKLTGDSLEFMDQQVNEWLDAHPQYEVKLVTSSIGTWTGKIKEQNLIVNVWV